MVFQELALWPHLTVRQHLELVAPNADHSGLLRAMEIEARANARPATLSGGEAQRLAISRALAVRPKVLLLDEPLGPLDRRLKELLLLEIRKAHGISQATSIYVTHDYDEAFRLADRVGVILNGRLVQSGTPEEVYEHPVSEEVARLTGPVTEFDGRWARPEWIEVRPDEQGPGCVRECCYRAGRWDVLVELGGRQFRAFSNTKLSGRVTASLRGG
jgi:ABC-type Fe3+/spermidine/putrescine transport system ATPase subunit